MAALVLVLSFLAAGGASGPRERQAGIDVSRFERHIGWARVAGSGVDFAFVQASRGRGDDCTVKAWTCGPDRFYAFNYRRAREEGLRVGPYHRAFAGGRGVTGARRDARAEALVFIRRVGRLQPGDLRPALDFETPFGGLGERALRAWIRAWSARIEGALGARPIIYTNASSWRLTGDARGFARAGHPLWVAHWGVASPSLPAAAWDGRGWSVWQYTNAGRVPGIRGRTSLNRLAVPYSEISVRSAGPTSRASPRRRVRRRR
ncbi:MAG TPA: glycoside hydrolase family 25 protein [Solirubrobacterales bacterium]|nr:glycoside hydrolase family 25 protein [Solirubrobacterales bacterium]